MREAVEGLESWCKAADCNEVGELRPQLAVAVVEEPFHRRFFDRAVYPLVPLSGRRLPAIAKRKAIGPRMVELGQPMLNAVRLINHVEAHWPGVDGVAVPGLLNEVNSIIR